MTFRGISSCLPAPFVRRGIVAVSLFMALGLTGGAALAEKADDGFGTAVTAYRAGKHAQALEGWRRLADEGNPLAQYNVGLLHYRGHGTTRSYAQALIWFHAAARQGLAVSYLRLGAMFENGEGVPRDLEQAYLWYTLAVSAFGPGPCRDKALDGRRSLAKNLTEAQVLKVLAESSEWAPGPLGGVGQPCFDAIAVRPVDGMERSVAVAKKAPKVKQTKMKSAVVAEKPAAEQTPAPPAKQVAQVEPKKAQGLRDTKTAAETTVTPPAKAASAAQALMTKMPAKMPGAKASAQPGELAAVDPQDEGRRKQAGPLPLVDVAKRKVHTVRPPGSGKIPLVGTSPRPAYTPKTESTVAKPAVKEPAMAMAAPAIKQQPAEEAQANATAGAAVGGLPAKPAPTAMVKPAVPVLPAETKKQPVKEKAVALAPAKEDEPRRMPAVAMPESARPASPPVREMAMPAPMTPKPAKRAAEPVKQVAMPAVSPGKTETRKAAPARKHPAIAEKVGKNTVRKSTARTRVAKLTRSKRSRSTTAYAKPQTVYVQLGALSTRKTADSVWDRLRVKNEDIIGGHQRLIVKFHADNGKVLYRLYAGPFESGGKADAFCSSLKQRSEACFIPPKFRKRG